MGSSEPTGRVQPAIVSDNHRAPVRKRYRAPWLQSWRPELRERVLGLSAVWPSGCASVSSESGRMAVRCASVSVVLRERVRVSRERVPSCTSGCPGCGGHMVGVLRGCAVEHFPQLHASFHVARAVSLGVSDLLRGEVPVAP